MLPKEMSKLNYLNGSFLCNLFLQFLLVLLDLLCPVLLKWRATLRQTQGKVEFLE